MHGLIIVLLCSTLCVNSSVVPGSDSESNAIAANNICHSDSCAKASKKMLSYMDESVNPCDDFYEFACGGYLRRTVIPDDKSSLTSFSLIQDKVDKQLEAILTEEPLPSDIKPFKLAKILTKTCLDEATLNKNGEKSTSMQNALACFYCEKKLCLLRNSTDGRYFRKIRRMAGCQR